MSTTPSAQPNDPEQPHRPAAVREPLKPVEPAQVPDRHALLDRLTYLVTSDDQTLCRALKLIGGMLLGLMVFIGFLALVVSLVPSMRQLLVEFILPLLVAGGGTLGLAKMAKKKDPAASPKAPPEAVPAPPEPGPPAPEALQGSNAEEVDPPPPREQE